MLYGKTSRKANIQQRAKAMSRVSRMDKLNTLLKIFFLCSIFSFCFCFKRVLFFYLVARSLGLQVTPCPNGQGSAIFLFIFHI